MDIENQEEVSQPVAHVRFMLDSVGYLNLTKHAYQCYTKMMKKKYKVIISIGYLLIMMAILAMIFSKSYLYVTGNTRLPSILVSIFPPIFIAAFIALIFVGVFKISKWRYLAEMKRNAKKIEQASPFEYDFYETGFVTNEPHQKGQFYFHDFAEINLYKDFLTFVFCPQNVKGYEWTKNYSNMFIPLTTFAGKEEFIESLKTLENFCDLRSKY